MPQLQALLRVRAYENGNMHSRYAKADGADTCAGIQKRKIALKVCLSRWRKHMRRHTKIENFAKGMPKSTAQTLAQAYKNGKICSRYASADGADVCAGIQNRKIVLKVCLSRWRRHMCRHTKTEICPNGMPLWIILRNGQAYIFEKLQSLYALWLWPMPNQVINLMLNYSVKFLMLRYSFDFHTNFGTNNSGSMPAQLQVLQVKS